MNHMIFLLFARTTTSTLCSIIYMLAKHPEWQEILAENEGLRQNRAGL